MTTCHLCEHDLTDAPVVGTRARHGLESRRVCCPNCGLVQVCPQPSEEELDAHYRDGYRAQYKGTTQFTVSMSDGTQRVWKPDDPDFEDGLKITGELQASSALRYDLPPGTRVLEVGCGEGYTLGHYVERGWDVVGIEPDPAAADVASKRSGCTVAAMPWQVYSGDGFDMLCSYHVLEHLPRPLEFLAWARQRLKRGGRLVLEVPNVDKPNGPLEENYWQWVHLYDFSAHTLAATLERAGFDGIEVAEVCGVIRAWAVNGDSEPREYVQHKGPSGHAQALFLHSYAARNRLPPDPPEELDRYMAGEDEVDHAAVRRQIVRMSREAGDAVATLGAVQSALGQWCTHAEQMGYAGFDLWSHDPQIRGQMFGECHTWIRAAHVFRLLHDSIQRARSTVQERVGS